MKLSRKVLAAAVVAVLASGLVFAGGGKETKAAESGKVTLKVLNYLDMTSANSADELVKVWEAFSIANPILSSNVKISLTSLFTKK